MVTSVPLICDAWFDLLTAHRGGDLLVSAATALFGEIPIAVRPGGNLYQIATGHHAGDRRLGRQPPATIVVACTADRRHYPAREHRPWMAYRAYSHTVDRHAGWDDGDVQREDEGRVNRAAR